MFTGLVETLGKVVSLIPEGPGMRLTVKPILPFSDTRLGDSIAVNGCCLTVVSIDEQNFAFEAGSETLSRTNLGQLELGSRVNLERSLKVGDRMGGHFVSGHVDALGKLVRIEPDEKWSTLTFSVPPALTTQMASKGSVTVDGVSLTLVDVTEETFSVALIPHTLEMTTLGSLEKGSSVNIETDILAKYVSQQVSHKNRQS
ncbi:MAG: riboflavin synthase [Pirellulaceae bacterium]|nr:riboflavin synthase [Pirellulaceae bacterium]